MRIVGLWNNAAVGKLVWHIGCGKDDLWVKWVHSIYIKGANWWTYKSRAGASWSFKQIGKVKEELTLVDMQTWSVDHKYSIKKVYDHLFGLMPQLN